jgi:hypothetical protein
VAAARASTTGVAGEQPGVGRDPGQRHAQVAGRGGLVAVHVGAQLVGGTRGDRAQRVGVGLLGVAARGDVLEVLEHPVVQPGAHRRPLDLDRALGGARPMVGPLAPGRRTELAVGASLPHAQKIGRSRPFPYPGGRISGLRGDR